MRYRADKAGFLPDGGGIRSRHSLRTSASKHTIASQKKGYYTRNALNRLVLSIKALADEIGFTVNMNEFIRTCKEREIPRDIAERLRKAAEVKDKAKDARQ